MFDKKKEDDILWLPEPIAIPANSKEFQKEYKGKWVYGADRAKLIDLTRSTRPSLLSQLHKFKELAQSLGREKVRNKEHGGPER